MSLTGKTANISISISFPPDDSVGQSFSLTLEAVDAIQVSVPIGTLDSEVDLSGSASIADNSILIVKSSRYINGISYKINSSSNSPILLRNAHMFAGIGSIQAINFIPDKIFITNNSLSAVDFTIIVGRSANI